MSGACQMGGAAGCQHAGCAAVLGRAGKRRPPPPPPARAQDWEEDLEARPDEIKTTAAGAREGVCVARCCMLAPRRPATAANAHTQAVGAACGAAALAARPPASA